ncbi:MAG: hypothetical protein MSC50_04190 [Campylobacter sp.]|nr:hypothetical protein [Campylobacter sp.]
MLELYMKDVYKVKIFFASHPVVASHLLFASYLLFLGVRRYFLGNSRVRIP